MPNHQDMLIHPLMVDTVAKTHFPNRIVIANATIVYDSANEPTTVYIIDGMLGLIEAYIEPLISKVGQEIRRKDETIVSQAWNISLDGYFPTIDELDQATDEIGRVFNIISTNFDAFHTQTNLVAEIVH